MMTRADRALDKLANAGTDISFEEFRALFRDYQEAIVKDKQANARAYFARYGLDAETLNKHFPVR